MSMLDVALSCIARGWFIFPCAPRKKQPLGILVPRGVLDATNDEATIRRWWTAAPAANVGVACGPSGLVVLDIDDGLDTEADLKKLFPEDTRSYTVRTGRRSSFGVQVYYTADGTVRKTTGYAVRGCSGEVRTEGAYVMAAGSIHPSGEPYTVLIDAPVAPMPEWVRDLAPEKATFDPATSVDDETADGWKTWLYEYADKYEIVLRGYEKRVPNGWWLGIHCPWGEEHGSGPGAESSTVLGILDGKIAFECSHGTCKAAKHNTAAFRAHVSFYFPPDEPGAEPTVTLGDGLPMPKAKPDTVVDWRTVYHTREEVVNCPKPTFLIEGFLQCGSICAIAAPVAQRKSLIVLNIAESLCKGNPLFGFLAVHNRPSRVLYHCPEMGLVSLGDRIQRIGLTGSLGETLFLRTMNLPDMAINEIPREALPGSVLILDTAARFTKGDENSVSDMKAFSNELFAIQREQGPTGAIVILYHSPKATKEAAELTLENCLRGSGELGAAVTDAHGTRLQNPEDTHGSASFIRHIKARDYKGLPDFEVFSDETGRLTAREDPHEAKVTLSLGIGGNKSNKDGRDDEARAIIAAAVKDNPDVTIKALVSLLRDAGIVRGKTWVTEVRLSLRKTGSKHTA
jgi:hypothetical protein